MAGSFCRIAGVVFGIFNRRFVPRAAARYARSQGRMEHNANVLTERSMILGANWRFVNAKSAMLQDNKPDAACM